MKYICLGYLDEKKWVAMSESKQSAVLDECFAYDDVLRKNGHFVGGEALQSARNAATLQWKNGKVSVIDGPFEIRPGEDISAMVAESERRRSQVMAFFICSSPVMLRNYEGHSSRYTEARFAHSLSL